MSDNCKSNYSLKNIFSLVNDKPKLNLIRYNKKIQKRLGIDIQDYKLFNGIAVTIEENGKAIEYDNYNDIIIFEGEFKQGKKNGKGKEYNSDGKMIYEGEFLYGKRHGRGKEYDGDGLLIYDGEYSSNERHGKGKEYYKQRLIYEENIKMEKNLVKGKNIINLVKSFLKGNFYTEEKMEKEKNIILMVYYYLKENIYIIKNGREKAMINLEILFIN